MFLPAYPWVKQRPAEVTPSLEVLQACTDVLERGTSTASMALNSESSIDSSAFQIRRTSRQVSDRQPPNPFV